mgnify:CR=1 FL=1
MMTAAPPTRLLISVRDPAGKETWSGTTDAEGVAILPGTSKLSRLPVEESGEDWGAGFRASMIWGEDEIGRAHV